MKLSEALELKKQLVKIANNQEYLTVLTEYVEDLKRILEMYPVKYSSYHGNIQRVCEESITASKQIHGPIIDIVDNLDHFISQQEKNLKRESFDRYAAQTIHRSEPDILANKLFYINEELKEDLKFRLKGYSNWKYAAAILRPAGEELINEIVDCDPLYLVDQSPNLVVPAMNQFNPLYKERLAVRVSTENFSNQPFLECLPEAQLGLVLAVNFFNHQPMQIIEQYFKEIWTKLKPGGALLFTYANTENPHVARLYEKESAPYTTRTDVLNLINDTGFTIYHEIDDEFGISWFECIKPGDFSSIRGGQTLARIENLNGSEVLDDHTIDNKVDPVYTIDKESMLKEVAIAIGIIDRQGADNNRYRIDRLDKMVRKHLRIKSGLLTHEQIEKLYNEKENL